MTRAVRRHTGDTIERTLLLSDGDPRIPDFAPVPLSDLAVAIDVLAEAFFKQKHEIM